MVIINEWLSELVDKRACSSGSSGAFSERLPTNCRVIFEAWNEAKRLA